MEAKDTVMNPIKLSETIQYFPDWDLGRGNQFIEELCAYIAKAQAEISFKAGRKEVVEFIDNLIIGIEDCKFEERLDGDKGCIVLDMNENQWRAKLKEWGL